MCTGTPKARLAAASKSGRKSAMRGKISKYKADQANTRAAIKPTSNQPRPSTSRPRQKRQPCSKLAEAGAFFFKKEVRDEKFKAFYFKETQKSTPGEL